MRVRRTEGGQVTRPVIRLGTAIGFCFFLLEVGRWCPVDQPGHEASRSTRYGSGRGARAPSGTLGSLRVPTSCFVRRVSRRNLRFLSGGGGKGALVVRGGGGGGAGAGLMKVVGTGQHRPRRFQEVVPMLSVQFLEGESAQLWGGPSLGRGSGGFLRPRNRGWSLSDPARVSARGTLSAPKGNRWRPRRSAAGNPHRVGPGMQGIAMTNAHAPPKRGGRASLIEGWASFEASAEDTPSGRSTPQCRPPGRGHRSSFFSSEPPLA